MPERIGVWLIVPLLGVVLICGGYTLVPNTGCEDGPSDQTALALATAVAVLTVLGGALFRRRPLHARGLLSPAASWALAAIGSIFSSGALC